jgi:hypothetical protein
VAVCNVSNEDIARLYHTTNPTNLRNVGYHARVDTVRIIKKDAYPGTLPNRLKTSRGRSIPSHKANPPVFPQHSPRPRPQRGRRRHVSRPTSRRPQPPHQARSSRTLPLRPSPARNTGQEATGGSRSFREYHACLSWTGSENQGWAQAGGAQSTRPINLTC